LFGADCDGKLLSNTNQDGQQYPFQENGHLVWSRQPGKTRENRMRRFLKILGGVAVVVVSFLATTFVLDLWWPVTRCSMETPLELKRPFAKSGTGYAYVAAAPKQFQDSGNDLKNVAKSPLLLCENGRPIGPVHTPLNEIQTSGSGRFTHWGTNIFFSTSDNSDPNTNGRVYSVVQK
jgi:hypothetical protein